MVTSNFDIKFVHLVDLTFRACFTGKSPRGGASLSQAGESETKLLYQQEPDPLIYIVPVSSISGRLPVVPAGDHGTIPVAMRNSQSQLFKHGGCDEDGRPGCGSKHY